MGLAVARDAASRGMSVTVLERGWSGRRASWAAAGMLSPLGEAREGDVFLEAGLRSLDLYPDWIRSLEEESGVEVEYERAGKLRVALREEEVEGLEARRDWARKRGVEHRWLEPGQVLERFPSLPGHVAAGLLVEEDHRLENRRLGETLSVAARRAGATLVEGTGVRGLTLTRERATGVTLEEGTHLPGGQVLVAAGAWSGGLQGLPRPLPVRPVRGQILSLDHEPLANGPVLESERIYLVPRRDGRLVVGATEEEAGFQTGLTADGVRGLLAGALELVPALASAPILELWAGLRPGTPDRNPLMGRDPEVPNLLYATGHFRNGILLAPLTAAALGALAAGEEGPQVPEPFLPGRFAGAGVVEGPAFQSRHEARD